MLIFLFPLVAGIPVFDGYFCHKVRIFEVVDKMVILKRELEGVLKQFDMRVLGRTGLSPVSTKSLVARIVTRHTEAGSTGTITRAQSKAPMFWGVVYFTEGNTLSASSSSLRVDLCREGTCLEVPDR